VTVLFADLAGSTALHERLDPESVRAFMESYYDVMRAAIAARGGTLVKLLGDGVLAAFGVPHVAEDDAIRAVLAGADMQQEFLSLGHAHADIALRVAINTGEVVVGADNTDIVGDPVNVAARLQQEARAGDVVIGEATRRLVAARVTLEPLGSFALRGRAEQVKAYRVVSLERPTGAAAVAFVGRDDELGRISAVYDDALAKPAARLAVLLGSPGLGKSRLIDELTRRLGETTTVLAAHCDAAGGATFAPIAAAVRELLDTRSDPVERGDPLDAADIVRSALETVIPESDTERSRIAAGMAALLAGSPASPEETFFVIRRFLTGLAQMKPVVLVIDDLHWAEPLLLDLVEHLVQWGSGVPLLVLVAARPELRDVRSSLVTRGGLVSDVVTLGGLDAGAAMRLAANVIGASDLPAAVAAKVLSTSEGNPLFVGELVRMLVDQGALERQGDRWIIGANLAALEMPPTIHALLAARIERLRPEERAVLEHASVVGRHFSRSAVAALIGRNGSELDARLEALRRTELIEPDTGWFLGEPVLRFHHVLIRDAAYRRLLKGTRAALHAQLADWIEATVGDKAEHDETIGRHLEQAHQLLRELGPLDERGRTLGARAAIRLSTAGRRALAGDDVPLAANLLGRAIDRLERDDPTRAELALDWCEALLSAGDVAEAKTALTELSKFLSPPSTDSAPADEVKAADVATADALHTTRRLSAWHTCFTGQLTVLTAPQGLQSAAESVAAAAEELAALGDSAGEAKAHFVHALALARLGEVGSCEAALDRALAAARGAGDRRRANTVLAIAPIAALWGPSPVTRASGRCLDVVRVLRITQGAPAVEAVALSCQGVLEALRGRTDAARRMIASARKMVEELGITQRLLEADVSAGLVALLEGDAPAAERDLRGAYEGLRDLGLGIDAARAAALLGRALLAQGRDGEAEALSHESEQLAGDDLKAAIAWRGVRAEAVARRGDHWAAVELASKAVELAAATDALLDHADARLALAAALRAAGRYGEADAEDRRARELWETKGATLLAERAQRAGAGGTLAAASVKPSTTSQSTPASPTPAAAAAGARATAQRATVANPFRYGLRLPHNFAMEELREVEAAVAACDLQALESIYRPDITIVDHQYGLTYRCDEVIARVRTGIEESTDSAYLHEPLATLGDFVALCRVSRTASGSISYGIRIGATEMSFLLVMDCDEQARARWIELFKEDNLGDAVACLYERHAALLPEGGAADRARATARIIRTYLATAPDLEAWCADCAPAFELIDHRTIGFEPVRGIAAMREYLRALFEAEDFELRVDDILRLCGDAILFRQTTHGTARGSGGAYERHLLSLWVFADDGRLSRKEDFDVACEAEALARFDALTSQMAPRAVHRRVRPNAASAGTARIEAAFVAGDTAAFEAEFDASLEVVAHPTGATYGRAGHLDSMRRLARVSDPELHFETLATLGDALVLSQLRIAASGVSGARYDVGPYERIELVLTEVADGGRAVRVEMFAVGHFGGAIVRLYERYAELLPEGPERTRAAGVARSIRVYDGPVDPDHLATALAPSCRIVDHRVLRTWSARDAGEHVTHWRLQRDLAPDFAHRFEDVLACEADALLVRLTAFGTARDSGGAFENRVCAFLKFGADGRVTGAELFEAEHEAEARARFDARAGGGAEPEGPFANVASRADRRLFDRFNARDWAGIEALAAPDLVFDERRRMLRNTCGRAVWLEQFRILFDVPASRFTTTLRATRGERLSLSVHDFTGEVAGGGGPLAMGDHLVLQEVDRDGRFVAMVLFDLEDEDTAYAELDARYESGEGAVHGPIHSTFARATAHRDWDAIAALAAPTFVQDDHRSVAVLGTSAGGAAWTEQSRVLVDLAPDAQIRIDHIRNGPRGFLWHATRFGTHEDGDFELRYVGVTEIAAPGKVARVDFYDPEDLDQARARFDEMHRGQSAASSAERFSNAATATVELHVAAVIAHDWQAFVRLLADDFRISDRRRVVQLELDRDQYVAFSREVADGRTICAGFEVIATRGNRLALTRSVFEYTDADIGPSEIASLILNESDERGRIVAYVRWDLEDLDAAYAELDRRYEAGEGAAYGGKIAERVRVFTLFNEKLGKRDCEALAAYCAPEFVEHDHRPCVGLGMTHVPEQWAQKNVRTYADLVPDSIFQIRHLRMNARGALWQGAWEGSRYEIPILGVSEFDDRSKLVRLDVYEPEQFAAAQARFAKVNLPLEERAPSTRFANAATRSLDRQLAWHRARDWRSAAGVFEAGFRYSDRRRMVQLELGREEYVEFVRHTGDMAVVRVDSELMATRGDRLVLVRLRCQYAGGDVGPSDIEDLDVFEVDERGACVARVRFDPDDLDAAYAELDRRYEAGEGTAHVAPWRSIQGCVRGVERRDWDAIIALCAASLVEYDHRSLAVIGTTRGAEAWVENFRTLAELSPDTIYRVDHFRPAAGGYYTHGGWHGTREGGLYEIPLNAVFELAGDGRIVRVDIYDDDGVEAALARFAELQQRR
jgi:class 3 adenylate cyclase/tetratricopeptide (TPR) repeat protein